MRAVGQTPSAVAAAQAASQAWRQALELQQAAEGDHLDFQLLAAEVVGTLRAIEVLDARLIAQVIGYGRDHALRDDEGRDAVERLGEAIREMRRATELMVDVELGVALFGAALSHIELEDPS